LGGCLSLTGGSLNVSKPFNRRSHQWIKRITILPLKWKINAEYVEGWQSGYVHNPPREAQRTTEAYEAGYEDGKAHNVDNFSSWAGK